MTDLLDELRDAIGESRLAVEADVRASYEVDWTRRWMGTAIAVARPTDTTQVAAVVRACARHGVPIVAQGGNTGLVGGGVPVDGGVVVSLRGLTEIAPVEGDTMLVGAGAVLADVQRAAHLAGLSFGVDLAARDSATIGGMVATDAGGLRVVAHGTMRAQVLGLTAVLADGRVVRTIAGEALHEAFVGSEGTLGIVTTVRLRLRPPVGVGATLLVEVEDAARTGAVVADLAALARAHGGTLLACEVMTRFGLATVASTLGLQSPSSAPVTLLVDLSAPTDETVVAAVAASGGGDAMVARDAPTMRRLWHLREQHSEVAARLGPPTKLDVRVPPSVLGPFLQRLDAAVRAVAPTARTICFGHAAVGGMHVNVLGAGDGEQAVTEAVYGLVTSVGGDVVSEHGVGRAKRDRLGPTHPRRVAVEAAKRRLDPAGLLNPGVMLPQR